MRRRESTSTPRTDPRRARFRREGSKRRPTGAGSAWALTLWLPLAVMGSALGCEEPPPEPDPPVEVTEPPAPEPAPDQAPEEEFPPPGIDHTIAEGQTLWQIARAYHVSVHAIMEANRMRPRDIRRLRAGQTVRIPGAEAVIDVVHTPEEPEELPPVEDGAYHRLADGETLWDVARRYDVPLAAITDRNELDDDAVRLLRPGRAIIIPGATRRQVARVMAARESGDDSSSGGRGFRHTVTSGETVWDLAGAFGVTVSELMAANGLDEAGVRNLREGSRIWIPGVQRDRGGRVRRTLTGRQRTAAIFASRLGLGTLDAARQLLRGRVERRWIAAATRRGSRDRMPGTLLWPVTRGWFVRGYGSGEGGYHLATDIMGRIGWNVRAAAPGIVGYAGDEVPGYGNMVMIIHPGGWVTMYAHNSANSVVAGERVPRGGIIGEVGSTGISRGPHVHFEFMHDGRNCDPISLWRPGVRHRNGRRSRVPPVTWTRADRRPDEVQCDRRRRHPRSRWVSHETFDEH